MARQGVSELKDVIKSRGASLGVTGLKEFLKSCGFPGGSGLSPAQQVYLGGFEQGNVGGLHLLAHSTTPQVHCDAGEVVHKGLYCISAVAVTEQVTERASLFTLKGGFLKKTKSNNNKAEMTALTMASEQTSLYSSKLDIITDHEDCVKYLNGYKGCPWVKDRDEFVSKVNNMYSDWIVPKVNKNSNKVAHNLVQVGRILADHMEVDKMVSFEDILKIIASMEEARPESEVSETEQEPLQTQAVVALQDFLEVLMEYNNNEEWQKAFLKAKGTATFIAKKKMESEEEPIHWIVDSERGNYVI